MIAHACIYRLSLCMPSIIEKSIISRTLLVILRVSGESHYKRSVATRYSCTSSFAFQMMRTKKRHYTQRYMHYLVSSHGGTGAWLSCSDIESTRPFQYLVASLTPSRLYPVPSTFPTATPLTELPRWAWRSRAVKVLILLA